MNENSKRNKKSSSNIQKILNKNEVKENIKAIPFYDEHPDKIYEKIGAIINKKKDDWSNAEKEYFLKYISSIDSFGSSHTGLAETQKEGILRTTIVELANNLIEEYSCGTSLEKTLCEVIANSYGKIMRISKRLDSSLDFEYFGHERNSFISIMSKELERANRSYLSALTELIEMKKPHTSINIKTKNAYIAQNQQINTNQSNDNENIKD